MMAKRYASKKLPTLSIEEAMQNPRGSAFSLKVKVS